jgi:3-oxoacyl-[acyl-carrier protein] reductase
MATLRYDFSGRSVIVTGAARGIGLEVGRCFQDAGATTFLVDVDADALADAAGETGARTIVADVSDTGSVEAMLQRVIGDTGRIDVLINNAGILRDTVLWKLGDEDWEAVLGTHLGGTFRCTRACVPHFREAGRGSVINVTSYTGMHGNFGQAAYAAAKAGIIGFTKTAAKELARFGVTVNAISPNAETRMVQSMPPDVYERSKAMIPLGRFGEPYEMAAACAFFASDEARYITGTVLPVDGGISM